MNTKGEILLKGIDRLREGFDLISGLGTKQDLFRLLVTSPTAAKQLKDLVTDSAILQRAIISMVAARNSRLSPGTVEGVISDFMDVIFDLSQPVTPHAEQEETEEGEEL